MPLYRFICSECEEDFEELVQSFSAVDKVVCPKCSSKQVERQLSRIGALSVSGGGSSASSFTGAACTGST